MTQLDILYEDKDLIVVIKPAGVQSQSADSFQDDMVSLLKKHIAGSRQEGTGDEPYIGVVHRLDTMVEGVMVYAKTRDAAAQLSRQVRDGDIGKRYQAVLCGIPKDKTGHLTDYLVQDARTNMSRVAKASDAGAKQAELTYRLLDKKFVGGEQLSRVEIELITGRHHQIRVQFASRGWPVLGDIKYGSRKADRLYLVSGEISFTHPRTKKKMTFKGRELPI